MLSTSDFITPTTGNVVVKGGLFRLPLISNADLNTGFEGNEQFRIVLRKDSDDGPIVAISNVITLIDLSNTRTYSIVDNLSIANIVLERNNVIFTLNTFNVSTDRTLYYYTTGNVSNSSFVQGNTGTFNVAANGNASILLTTSNIQSDTSQEFILNIAETQFGTPNVTSNLITILDANIFNVQAAGGSIVTSGGYRIHTFTSSSDLTVISTGISTESNVEYLIVAGGGSGGEGGGGAGGFRTGTATIYGSNTYTITVGAGGTGGTPDANGSPGNPSTALAVTSTGGGGGSLYGVGLNGGSGGGGGTNPAPTTGGGTATPPGQGNPGGAGYRAGPGTFRGGGGGGRGASGTPGPSGGNGGAGLASSISGSPVLYAGGGGAGSYNMTGGTGGPGGGGPGAPGGTQPKTSPSVINGVSGTANRGGGGGGRWRYNSTPVVRGSRGNGGSGIVIVRYPYTT
jgi:hypothetical protein